VELDHLHVDQLGTGTVPDGEPIACPARRVRGDIVYLGPPAGCENRCVRPDGHNLALPVEAEGPDDAVTVTDEIEGGHLVLDCDVCRGKPLDQGHHHLVASPVTGIARPGETLASKGPLGNFAAVCHVKDSSPCEQVLHPPGGFGNKDADEFGVIEVCPALHRVLVVDLA